MTLRLVPDEPSRDELDAEFLDEVELRAELIVARMFLAHWERRVRELERRLPPESALRRDRRDV